MVARNRVILDGTLGTGEVWSTGITYVGPGGEVEESQIGLQAWADAIAAGLEVAMTGTRTLAVLGIGNDISQVTVQQYAAVGGIAKQAVAAIIDLSGGATANHPLPTSIVYSLRTALPGASFRGRNYWPAVAGVVSQSGFFTTPDTNTAHATGWANILEFLGESSTLVTTPVPHVYSPTLNVVTPVTVVQAGDVPDTQRRRRDALIETYASVPYPPA